MHATLTQYHQPKDTSRARKFGSRCIAVVGHIQPCAELVHASRSVTSGWMLSSATCHDRRWCPQPAYSTVNTTQAAPSPTTPMYSTRYQNSLVSMSVPHSTS